ncbi:tRNA (adenosine(37)-N6)-threonylcarbamoyltransferase complex ATPase subunit type 1 TsaE [Aquisalimonas sp.]|uniref:tRNA (adenosine(37)-N6)-threonylcarbamoyltransferase complex ATPase subunit type 1 TsaE n=1 Tax=Aquisalimonas sp. TaxID=1872621 RepID=UPI0025BBD496|nr:tRNA (adenosine(37)-N6)-threonylcarbamoyltransferase complex ATPase subunit type 1 TsaE [Aquisalimonas sp.]
MSGDISGLERPAPVRVILPDADATAALGEALWHAWHGEQCVIGLDGDLGLGKTTLVRGLLRAAGHAGSVRSPTYTLMEPYAVAGRRVLHLDLYRLGEPDELELLGLRDELGPGCLILVEWPCRGRGALPREDLRLHLDERGDGREARLAACSATGRAVIADILAGTSQSANLSFLEM